MWTIMLVITSFLKSNVWEVCCLGIILKTLFIWEMLEWISFWILEEFYPRRIFRRKTFKICGRESWKNPQRSLWKTLQEYFLYGFVERIVVKYFELTWSLNTDSIIRHLKTIKLWMSVTSDSEVVKFYPVINLLLENSWKILLE